MFILAMCAVFLFAQCRCVRLAQCLGAGAVTARIRLNKNWDWRSDKLPLDDNKADIWALEQRLGIKVKGYWITDSVVDPSSLDKRAMQRRREQVAVSPGQLLWLDAKKPGESLNHILPCQASREDVYASHLLSCR
jgi:hypothetical protein